MAIEKVATRIPPPLLTDSSSQHRSGASKPGHIMDATLISAASALGGASIGGAISFLGTWIVQQRQVRAQWLAQNRLRRQDLYKEFMQIASKCFADALQHDNPDLTSLVVLYEKLSRMRVISSARVLAAAKIHPNPSTGI